MTRKVPDVDKALRGTVRPCRERSIAVLYPDHLSRPDPADIPPPEGMSPAAAEIWVTKVSRYRQRGQKVDGCQDALRQYCELEAVLIEAWKDGRPGLTGLLTTYRAFANDFYDTPSSQRIVMTGGKEKNPFARHGKFGA